AQRDDVERASGARGLDNRLLPRVELEDGRRVRLLGQPAACALEVLGRVLEREVDVGAVREVQVDADAAFLDLGLDADQVLGDGERGLERLRHRLLEHLRLDAGVVDARADLRVHDGGQQVQRQPGQEEAAEHQHHGRQHDGADGPADREARDVGAVPAGRVLAHDPGVLLSSPGVAVLAGSSGRLVVPGPGGTSAPTGSPAASPPTAVRFTTRTLTPSRSTLPPTTTTVSPGWSPARTSTRPSEVRPVRMSRRTALPSSTMKTASAPAAPTTAVAGTSVTPSRCSSVNVARARKPGRAIDASAPSMATSTGTRRVAGSAAG